MLCQKLVGAGGVVSIAAAAAVFTAFSVTFTGGSMEFSKAKLYTPSACTTTRRLNNYTDLHNRQQRQQESIGVVVIEAETLLFSVQPASNTDTSPAEDALRLRNALCVSGCRSSED
ncbi:hypothetical protein MRX96_010524 [Rhipicephalus microplus]